MKWRVPAPIASSMPARGTVGKPCFVGCVSAGCAAGLLHPRCHVWRLNFQTPSWQPYTVMNSKILIFISAVIMCGCVPRSQLAEAQLETQKVRAESAQKIAQLEVSLTTTQKELRDAKELLARKPEMPVRVTFRRALLGNSYVAVIDTTIKKNFPVLVTVSSKALGTERQYRLDLAYNSSAEIGHSEGSPIGEGDVVQIRNTEYQDLSVSFSSSMVR